MATATALSELGIDVEVDTLARLLTALSDTTTVKEALMIFHEDLPESEATLRSSLVLTRLDEILPDHVSQRLRDTDSHSVEQDDEPKYSFGERFGMVLAFLAVLVVFGVFVDGGIDCVHRISSYLSRIWPTLERNPIVRNIFFSLCTCSEHSQNWSK